MKYIKSFLAESFSDELSKLTSEIESLLRLKRETRARLISDGDNDMSSLLEIDKKLAPLEKRRADIFKEILAKK